MALAALCMEAKARRPLSRPPCALPMQPPYPSRLSTVGDDRDEELQQALLRLLSGPAVHQRTDDDKALALAVLLP